MYRVFLCILLLACSFSALAQKSKPQKEKSWKEQIIGSWKCDSTVALLDGRRNTSDKPIFKALSVSFLPDGRVAVNVGWDNEHSFFAITTCELLEGSSTRSIEIEERAPITINVEKIVGHQLVIRITEKHSSIKKTEGLLYLTRAPFTKDSYGFLAGKYFIDDLVSANNSSEFSKSEVLTLMENGKMISDFGGIKDSGTWRVNTETFTLELLGSKSKRQIEICKKVSFTLQLHPVDAPKDSFINLTTYVRPEIEPEITEGDPEQSYVVPAPAQEHVMDVELMKNWKAVTEGSLDNVERHDSIRTEILLNLKLDGSFTYTSGRKTVNGTWKRPTYDNTLVLTVKKKEQVANFSTSTIDVGTEENFRILPLLDLTFTDPTTGLVRKISFKPVE